MFCSVCGTHNDDNAMFCTGCGTPLSANGEANNQFSPQSQSPQQPQQQPQSQQLPQETTFTHQHSLPQDQVVTAQNQAPMQEPSAQPEVQYSGYASQRVKQINAFGIAGFVCACCAWFCIRIPALDCVLLIAGLVFSGIGATKQPQGFAIVGLVISIFQLLTFVLGFLAVVGCVACLNRLLPTC